MDESEDCGSWFRWQIVAHIRCNKAGGRRNNVVSTTHTSMLRLMRVGKQLSVLVTGMFERPLLLSLYNLKDVKCIRPYVVKLIPILDSLFARFASLQGGAIHDILKILVQIIVGW